MAAGPTHYQVLGIPTDSSVDDVHRAYLDAARRSHPDRNAGSEDAGESMARINEAWRILGHPGRRRQYDRELRGEPSYLGGSAGGSSRPTPSSVVLDDPDLVDVAPTHSLFGFLPWLLVFGALALIFVFTAYAAGGGGTPDPGDSGSQSRLGECVVITSGRPTVAAIDCLVGNDGQVVDEVEPGLPCPTGTDKLTLPGEKLALCLAG